MPSRLALAAALALITCLARGQGLDPNLQNLLAGLENGTEVRLVTPLASGLLQVTNFRPSARLSAADAQAYVERARRELTLLGEAQPSTEQIARMLAGGPIDVPAGRVHPRGLLTTTSAPATIVSQIVTPIGSAAAGGSAPSTGYVLPAREEALRQLAAIGILNPTEDQIRTALVGGTITTVNGPQVLPGIR
jgi:hypothetical protein